MTILEALNFPLTAHGSLNKRGCGISDKWLKDRLNEMPLGALRRAHNGMILFAVLMAGNR
jgi:DNA-binding HxlR family transcriptional regulator